MAASNSLAMNAVRFLLFAGADVNAQNTKGLRALHVASYRKNASLVELLIKAGADVNILDNNKNNPLMAIAVAGGHNRFKSEEADIAIAKSLIEKGINLNQQNSAGFVPFIMLSSMVRNGLPCYCWNLGASYNIDTPERVRMLDLALGYGFGDVAEFIQIKDSGHKEQIYAISKGKPLELKRVSTDVASIRPPLPDSSKITQPRKPSVSSVNSANNSGLVDRPKNDELSPEDLQGFIEADSNFNQLPFFAKKEWDGKRKMLKTISILFQHS